MRSLLSRPEVTNAGTFLKLDAISGIACADVPGRPHPPIWVGGGSDAAMKRAIRFGSAWHPNRFTIGWLRDQGLPRLRRLAAEAGAAMPRLCPRIAVDLREAAVVDDTRAAGVGSLEQVRGDLEILDGLGAEH